MTGSTPLPHYLTPRHVRRRLGGAVFVSFIFTGFVVGLVIATVTVSAWLAVSLLLVPAGVVLGLRRARRPLDVVEESWHPLDIASAGTAVLVSLLAAGFDTDKDETLVLALALLTPFLAQFVAVSWAMLRREAAAVRRGRLDPPDR